MELEAANEFAGDILLWLRSKGVECDIVGGIYKGKENPHDIDIIVNGDCLDYMEDIEVPDSNANIMVEFYITKSEMYDRLKFALRAHTFDIIKNRLMSGLRYSKKVVYVNC